MMPAGLIHHTQSSSTGMIKDCTTRIGDVFSSIWNALANWIHSSDSTVIEEDLLIPAPTESTIMTTTSDVLLWEGMQRDGESGEYGFPSASTFHLSLTNDLTPILSCNTDYDYFLFLLLLTFLSSFLFFFFFFRKYRKYNDSSKTNALEDHIKDLLKEIECLKKSNDLLLSENDHKTEMIHFQTTQVNDLSMRNEKLLDSNKVLRESLSLKTEECHHLNTQSSDLLLENESLRECLTAKVIENEMSSEKMKDLKTLLYNAEKENQQLSEEYEAGNRYFGRVIRDLKDSYENEISHLRDLVTLNMNELMQVNYLLFEMQQQQHQLKKEISSSPSLTPESEQPAAEKDDDLCNKVFFCHSGDEEEEANDDIGCYPPQDKLCPNVLDSYPDDHQQPTDESHSPRQYEVVVFGHSYVRDIASLGKRQIGISGDVFNLSYITVPGGTFSTFINNRKYLEDLKAKRPDFVIVILGGNDLGYEVDLSYNYDKCVTFYSLLRQTVQPDTLVIASQIENRFYKPNNRFGWPSGREFDRKRRHFNEFLKNKPFQDSILKVEGSDLLDKRDNFKSDGVHLNGMGLRRIFGAIEDKLREVSS